MGPRHCCRGIQDVAINGTLRLLLQWGHGIAAVESRKGRTRLLQTARFNGATALLPWNLLPTCHHENAKARFNGATALLPWNPLAMGLARGEISGFNGATALLPWNQPVREEPKPEPKPASMGPRHCCRGIAPAATFGQSSVPSGFNGATALLPWNRPPR